ncbi:MAG: haloacid dehalogenase type II [Alphaproteobacteria bacterium]|nr:haloacid dehalogenase type II [Alphaproteobacteria bacterium]
MVAPGPRLPDIAACVFDAYGTLLDFGSAVRRSAAARLPQADALIQLWRQKQLEYTWLRSLMNRHADFWRVTGESLDYAMEHLGLADPALRAELMQLYLQLDAYPEAPSVLRRLKGAGMRTAILSNGSTSMLAAGVATAKIRDDLDLMISVDEVSVYKPSPAVYGRAAERLGLPANRICFLSSNAWDAHGAQSFGFHVAWVNRNKLPADRLPSPPEIVVTSLDEVPALLGL